MKNRRKCAPLSGDHRNDEDGSDPPSAQPRRRCMRKSSKRGMRIPSLLTELALQGGSGEFPAPDEGLRRGRRRVRAVRMQESNENHSASLFDHERPMLACRTFDQAPPELSTMKTCFRNALPRQRSCGASDLIFHDKRIIVYVLLFIPSGHSAAGSASALGAEGRGFKSRCPDHAAAPSSSSASASAE